MQKKISVFVDEAGDFGKYDERCPYYMISMIFHDQAVPVKTELQKLDLKLNDMDLSGHVLHTGPLIRRESVYSDMSLQKRKEILTCFYSLFNKLNVSYHTFIVPKGKKDDAFKLIGALSREIYSFIENNSSLFDDNDIIVYYDNGQKQVGKILASVFNSLNCEFRHIKPENYRLFQIADFVTTLELINYKTENMENSRSEKLFFGSMRLFRKDYYKKIIKKKL